MDICFTNKKIAKVCNSGKEMQAQYGKRMADKLQQRLAECQKDRHSGHWRLPLEIQILKRRIILTPKSWL